MPTQISNLSLCVVSSHDESCGLRIRRWNVAPERRTVRGERSSSVTSSDLICLS